MNEVAKALESADWGALHLKFLEYAHYELRDYKWRGLRVEETTEGRLTVDGMGPEDFVIVAVEKLARGGRAYRSDLSLETNVYSAIDSEIANYHKKTRRMPLVDRSKRQAADQPDPVDVAADTEQPINGAEEAEAKAEQQQLREEFVRSLNGDEELIWILICYEADIYKPAAISAECGIPADRVSELKRKFEKRADKFMRTHPRDAEDNPILKEGP